MENGVSIGGIPKTVRENKGKSLLEFIDNYVVLDLETTGLDPTYDEIIEIAAIKISNGEKIAEFTTLVKPECLIDEYITQLTGITNEMVKDAPKIEKVLPELINFLGDSVIAAHNANFDINFLYDNCMFCINKAFSNNFIDTMRISRRLFKDIRHRLVDLSKEFKITADIQHRAMADCELTQKVYEYMRNHCNTNNIDLAAFHKTSHGKSFDLDNYKPESEEFDVSNPIYGMSVCFTGALEKFQRKDALQIVTNLGGIPSDSVTKTTNILVLGNNDYCSSIKDGKSNKQKKAEDLILKGYDLIIISEKSFYDML
ncbi:MAG: exonuclease domain-containing protein [Bacillota bacterium]|nr:exonuclease domain-containing protein [Bacillota bacterium]